MKAPLIQIKNLHISISTFTKEASAGLLAGSEAFYEEALKTGVMSATEPPALGEYWPGQGGIYAGVRQYPEGLCHVIFAATDVGKHTYGEYGTEVDAVSRHDGRENTAILVSRDGSHPAADAAYAFTCDGHSDFYLPSIGELNHAWQYIPESFEGEWYISSTQRSADTAYGMDFVDGWLDNLVKGNERLARPVRRILR
ncbi:Lcl C-terminal domain-containing protein [Pseudomonas lactis]|uniref:DUF1566 domain-containing protein n=1 Tax=Pseudomonas lactis TaxID=1615674 RepID=UPI00110C86A3|nr:DUF1566 domain-containing protein [Pseudomonas lactis]MBK3446041.1 DUF1566 domain-containing protein [Pseudomonas lactis]